MTNFISDLWADLREKRLWPVAVVLLAAVVAVPVVLKKSSEAPAPADPVATEGRAAPEPNELKGLANVRLAETEADSGSALDTFDPSDPFRPPAKVVKGNEEESGPSGSGVTPSETQLGGDPGLGGTTDGGSGGGVDTGSGGDTGAGDDTGSGNDPAPKTTQYAYVIDATFTANGRTRKLRGMERLDMLPNQAMPLLLFLGVSQDGGNAVFLVDSTLQTAGEGRCEPSPDECAFVHLGAGSEHEFTNEEGDSYTLRIDQIRKVKVDGATAATASKNSKKAEGQTARAAVRGARASRRFVSPLLSDLVSVSSSETGDSDTDQDRR